MAEVEAHLTTCTDCRAELASYRALSTLLSSPDPVVVQTTPEQFAAQVVGKLPRQDRRALPKSVLVWAWRLAPIVLVASWVFIQTSHIVTSTVLTLVGLGMGDELLAKVLPMAAGATESAPPLIRALRLAIASALPLDAGTIALLLPHLPIASLTFAALLGLTIGSWLATWLVRTRSKEARPA